MTRCSTTGPSRGNAVALCSTACSSFPTTICAGVSSRRNGRCCGWGSPLTSTATRQGTERIIPFDILPRIIEESEWRSIEQGLKQRITALNLFIDDIYHDQKIVKDGAIPEHVIRSASSFRPQCVGLNPPKGIWCHITGTDLVRDGDGRMYVLEDNLRCPSGVSYVLQNRQLMKQTFPDLFERVRVRPVDDYCSQLLRRRCSR